MWKETQDISLPGYIKHLVTLIFQNVPVVLIVKLFAPWSFKMIMKRD